MADPIPFAAWLNAKPTPDEFLETLELQKEEQLEDALDYAEARDLYSRGLYRAASNKQLVSQCRSEDTRFWFRYRE